MDVRGGPQVDQRRLMTYRCGRSTRGIRDVAGKGGETLDKINFQSNWYGIIGTEEPASSRPVGLVERLQTARADALLDTELALIFLQKALRT